MVGWETVRYWILGMKLPLDIERELIRKLINGDKIAFSHLFSFYKSQVLYYCVHFVKDKEIAEDITQDIFLTVWEKKEDIRIEQSFSAFLYTIARNRIYDIFRSLSARSVLYEKLMEQAIDYVDDVEKSLEEKEYSGIDCTGFGTAESAPTGDFRIEPE